ncbi:uncharacterized protein LOC128555553 [Mercenaria mercenaria]|uniref:uncharacterized protein LOC128555553 n=1 Tax=Mercenaria mercenaria TaxID=6596 RepID=UPI00234EF717|nr:uncharacterized protein LOC128555553 [Mercenaria mercenaria]
MDEACSTEEETDSEDEEQTCNSYDQTLLSVENSSDTQTLNKEDQTKASTENHSASIAFYVRDAKTGKVYGLTNRHITLQTDKIDIKMSNKNKFIQFGTSVKTLDYESLDIGLIEIDSSIKDQLSNKENVDQRVCIYSGPFESIHNKEIFKYRPSDKLYEVCKCGTPNYGIIVSEREHEESKPENGQFLVKSESGVFAVKGESGTAVAFKRKEDNVIELVGIICGGSGDKTVCLFLPAIIQFSEKRYGMTLELHESEFYCRDKTESNSIISAAKVADKAMAVKVIPYGVKIYFICSTPEQISPLSFDLVERTLHLMCLSYDTVNVDSLKDLVRKEHALSLLVSKRRSLNDNAIFESDGPGFVALENGMLACDFLYQGKAKPAENCLKWAILGVIKSDDLGLRLFCKLVTYITWYCLLANTNTSLDDLKRLLEDGIDSFECDFMSSADFPLETLGYLYFDYSRYYMTMCYNLPRRGPKQSNNIAEESFRLKAVEKAKQSVKIFKEDHNGKKSAETLRRLVLAKCQQVYALLGCGHDFNTCEEVSNEQVTEAEDIIKSMEEVNMKEIPLVQNVDYLIALCDLQYRKGHTSKALKTVRKCFENSEINEYHVGFYRAKCREEMLSKLK